MANITEHLKKVLTAVYGRDVRNSYHDALKAINEETENTTSRQEQVETRQTTLETKYDTQIKNITDSNPSNVEIVDMRTDAKGKTFDTAGKRLDNFDLQLEDKANKKDLRVFKPTFGANLIGEPCVDCNTIEEQKELLNKFKNIGIDTSSLCIELIQNSSGTLEIKNARGILDEVINYIVTNNIKIPVIHVYENYDSLTYGEDFKTKWVNGIKLVLDKVKDIDYTYMCVWNENTDKLYSTYVKDGILESYEEVRKAGKKAGIALAGIAASFRIDEEYLSKADFIAFNFYPQVSNKKMGTSIEDGIKAWQNNGLSEWLKYIEMKYPEKDILLTESGILDYWSALANPEGWGFNWYDSDTTGKVMEIFYTGLLETLKDTRIKYIFLWYPKSFIKFPEKMKKLLNKYLGGVIK